MVKEFINMINKKKKKKKKFNKIYNHVINVADLLILIEQQNINKYVKEISKKLKLSDIILYQKKIKLLNKNQNGNRNMKILLII